MKFFDWFLSHFGYHRIPKAPKPIFADGPAPAPSPPASGPTPPAPPAQK